MQKALLENMQISGTWKKTMHTIESESCESPESIRGVLLSEAYMR